MKLGDKNITTHIKNLTIPIGSVVLFLLFAVSFQANRLSLCDPVLFEKFAMGTEAFVINRIAVSDKLGLDAYGGFAGRIPELDNLRKAPVKLYKGKSRLSENYEKVYNYLNDKNFKPYYSNVCEQGNILAWIHNKKILDPGQNFSNYRWIFTIIASTIFCFLIYEVYKLFGIGVSIIMSLTIIQLDWLVASATHMFWFTGWFFLPFAINMYLLRVFSHRWKKLLPALLMCNLLFTFTKCLSSGFEVIPTYLVLTTLPAFLYFFVNKYKLLFGLLIFATISIGSLLGVSGSIVYQINKIDNYEGQKGVGYEHVIGSYIRRSGSDNLVKPNMRQKVKDSYSVSVSQVIKSYLPSTVMTIAGKSITAYALIWILIIIIALAFLLEFVTKVIQFSSAFWGLAIMTSVSLIGPLSMFAFFKSLSYLHPHLVPITWSLPFAFLATGLLFRMMQEVLPHLITTIKNYRTLAQPEANSDSQNIV